MVDVTEVAARVYVIAESLCAMRRGITGIERQLAAGEAGSHVGEWRQYMDELRERIAQLEATQRTSIEGLRQIRADLLARGEWQDDERIFSPCGCLFHARMCQRCGIEELRGCEHDALCSSCRP